MTAERQNPLTKKLVVALCAFLCSALWGSAIPMIKTGYALMGVEASDAASQVVVAGCRFMIAGILVLIFACIRERRLLLPDANVLRLAPVLCLAQTVGQYFFFYIGVANSTGVTGGILTGMGNFFAILTSCLIFRREKMTMRKCVGCLLGFAGVLAVNLTGSGGQDGFKLVGEGFILFSGMCYAISASMIGDFSKKASAVLLSGWQFFFGGLILAVMGICMGGSLQGLSAAAVLILVYLAFVSAVAYTLWSMLLACNPVSRVTIYGFINPICSIMLSAVILGEYRQVFQPAKLLALFLVCAGIYVVNRKTVEGT